jgi:hypothetical protein
MTSLVISKQPPSLHLRCWPSNGESGIGGGVSEDRIMNESRFNEGTDMATIEANRMSNLKQTELEAKGMRAGSVRQLSQVKQPSLIGSGLQIAGIYTDHKIKTDKLQKVTS